jgi:excisionase family DNA binding protein
VVSKRLLTRKEAAESLSMSLNHFERKVQPHLRIVRSGALRLVPADELDRWVRENQGFAG